MARRKVSGDGRADSGVKPTIDEPTEREVEIESPKADVLEAQAVETSDEVDAPYLTAKDFAEFDIPAEQPKKRGRKKGSPNKRKSDGGQTTDFVLSLVDVLGVSLAGDEGALNDTERTLLTLSLNEVSARYSEQVEKYAGYVYPVCGVLAIGLWGKRVFEVRNRNNEQKSSEQPAEQPINPITTAPTNGNVYSDNTLAQGVNRPF